MGVQVDLQQLGDATEKQVAQLAAVLSTIEGRHAQLVCLMNGNYKPARPQQLQCTTISSTPAACS
jgi:hypothetical protein